MSPGGGAQDGTPTRARPAGAQKLLEMGRLREQPARREEVAAVWRKAVESAGDAVLPGMSIDRGAALRL